MFYFTDLFRMPMTHANRGFLKTPPLVILQVVILPHMLIYLLKKKQDNAAPQSWNKQVSSGNDDNNTKYLSRCQRSGEGITLYPVLKRTHRVIDLVAQHLGV